MMDGSYVRAALATAREARGGVGTTGAGDHPASPAIIPIVSSRFIAPLISRSRRAGERNAADAGSPEHAATQRRYAAAVVISTPPIRTVSSRCGPDVAIR